MTQFWWWGIEGVVFNSNGPNMPTTITFEGITDTAHEKVFEIMLNRAGADPNYHGDLSHTVGEFDSYMKANADEVRALIRSIRSGK